METCEEEEMQSRTGIETLESIWRDMLATQRFEGLNRNWIWEDEVEARSATFTKNVHVAEEDARDLVMQQEVFLRWVRGDTGAIGLWLEVEILRSKDTFVGRKRKVHAPGHTANCTASTGFAEEGGGILPTKVSM